MRFAHLNLTRQGQVAFQIGRVNSHCRKQCTRACIVPQPRQHLVLSETNTGAKPAGVNGHVLGVSGLRFPDC